MLLKHEMSWNFYIFKKKKEKQINQQEFWFTNAKMWDLLTPSLKTASALRSHHRLHPLPPIKGATQGPEEGGGGSSG